MPRDGYQTIDDGARAALQLLQEALLVAYVPKVLRPGEEHDQAAQQHDNAGCVEGRDRPQRQRLHEPVRDQACHDCDEAIAQKDSPREGATEPLAVVAALRLGKCRGCERGPIQYAG